MVDRVQIGESQLNFGNPPLTNSTKISVESIHKKNGTLSHMWVP